MPMISKVLDTLINKDEEIKEVNRQAEHLDEFKILQKQINVLNHQIDRYKVQIENFTKESSTIPNIDCYTSELMLNEKCLKMSKEKLVLQLVCQGVKPGQAWDEAIAWISHFSEAKHETFKTQEKICNYWTKYFPSSTNEEAKRQRLGRQLINLLMSLLVFTTLFRLHTQADALQEQCRDLILRKWLTAMGNCLK